MEEAGHYYTVYFTSLAVGFNEEVAFRHGLLAQMPDEVGWLDAANMHINQMASLREHDMTGSKRNVPNRWRFDIEYGIHSLPDKTQDSTAAPQQAATVRMLGEEDPLSLKFGLLLHRLGDTYAHRVMNAEDRLYTVSTSEKLWDHRHLDSLGHARHGHDPDYPFLRPQLFIRYLRTLFRVLNEKARDPRNSVYLRRSKPLPEEQVARIFERMLIDKDGPMATYMRSLRMAEAFSGRSLPRNRLSQLYFIGQIRESAIRHLGIPLKDYAPERFEDQTLPGFVATHQEGVKGITINEQTVTETVNSIRSGLERQLPGR